MPNRVLMAEYESLDWEYVDSSNVERIAYAPDFGRLWVQFLDKPGSKYTVYVYFDVPESVWDDFRASDSKGMFVHYVLKRYGYEPFL